MSEDLTALEEAVEALADAAEAVLFYKGDARDDLRRAWQRYVDLKGRRPCGCGDETCDY